MTNEIGLTNYENVGGKVFLLYASSLFSRSSHARHVWKAQESVQNFLAWRIFDLRNANGVSNVEAPGFCTSQRL
jgi:hypothetical protein